MNCRRKRREKNLKEEEGSTCGLWEVVSAYPAATGHHGKVSGQKGHDQICILERSFYLRCGKRLDGKQRNQALRLCSPSREARRIWSGLISGTEDGPSVQIWETLRMKKGTKMWTWTKGRVENGFLVSGMGNSRGSKREETDPKDWQNKEAAKPRFFRIYEKHLQQN